MIRLNTMATIVRRPFFAVILLPTLVLTVPEQMDRNRHEGMTSEFGSGDTHFNSLVLLPRAKLFTKKRKVMTVESEAIGDSLSVPLAEQLCRKGYAVKVIAPDQLNADRDLQALVRHAKEQYNILFRQGPLAFKRVEERRYTIGEEGTLLAARLGVEGLVFASLIGYEEAHVVFQVGVINGKTGDMEAFFFTGLVDGVKDLIERRDETIASFTRAALKDYPVAAGDRGTSARAKGGAVVNEAQKLLGVQPSPEHKGSQQPQTVLDACRQ